MLSHLVLFLYAGLSISRCLNIDLSSIHVIPDVYRLCWKQLDAKNLSKIKGYDGPNHLFFSVFKDQHGSNTYCIERKEDSSTYRIHIPIEVFYKATDMVLNVNFQVTLGDPMPAIRKKVVANGVYLQLHPDFANISREKIISCEIAIIHGFQRRKDITRFTMRINDNPKYFKQMPPGTAFDIYYSCKIPESSNISSRFVTDQGTVFPIEETYPLRPDLLMPFRRLLVGELTNPTYIPRSFKIVIYENYSSTGKCLKIFRFYSASTINNRLDPEINSCDHKVTVEDIGAFQSKPNDTVHFVLDMVEPLRLDMRHKLSIFWMSPNNKLEENFIYFQPLPNENVGFVNIVSSSNYKAIRNKIPEMLQDVTNRHPRQIQVSQWITLSLTSTFLICPSVGIKVATLKKGTHNVTYDGLNQLDSWMCSKISESCTQKDEHVPLCTDGTYPFFYLMELSTTNKGTLAEVIIIPKAENLHPTNVTLLPRSRTYQFTISWNINSVPKRKVPSLFVVEMRQASNDECISMYIIVCKTCNKIHKQTSEINSMATLTKWRTACRTFNRLENHYEAMDSSITINTREMVSQEKFIADVYSIGFYSFHYLGRSKPNYIEVFEETFWSKSKIILIIVFCSVVLGLLLLLIWRSKRPKVIRSVFLGRESSLYDNDNDF